MLLQLKFFSFIHGSIHLFCVTCFFFCYLQRLEMPAQHHSCEFIPYIHTRRAVVDTHYVPACGKPSTFCLCCFVVILFYCFYIVYAFIMWS